MSKDSLKNVSYKSEIKGIVMSGKRNDEHIKVLRNIGIDTVRFKEPPYQLENGNLVVSMYSKYSQVKKHYFYGLPKDKFENIEKLFLLFICGSEQEVLIVPAMFLSELLKDTKTGNNNSWKIVIRKKPDSFKFEFWVSEKPLKDLSSYLNRYDLLGIQIQEKLTQSLNVQQKEEVIKPEREIEEQITFKPNYSKGKDNMENEVTESDEIEFEQPSDENVDDTIDERKIYTDKGDPEVESLYGKYKRGKLILQPDFQRHFVWDPAKSSRLIESALLDIPLPVIYLSTEKDGNEYVIDGQQRLTAFFSFIDGKFPNGRDFRLSGLKVFKDLNKRNFKELDEELQDKIRYCTMRAITFRKESDTNLKFEIFERLNTGSVSLNDQELRNCIYRGSYNALLKEFSQDKDFMYILNLNAPEKRMQDVGLVLRFTAFYHSTYLNYKPPIRRFLNTDMEKYQFINQTDSDELRKAFKNTVTTIKSLLDTHAFKRFYKGSERNPNGYWEPSRFNASLYDILMDTIAREDKNKVYQNLDSIREALISLMTDDLEFIDSIELSTSSVQAVRKRFDKWRNAVAEILGAIQKEPRCFSLNLKKEFYHNDPTCNLCGQRINNIDDAAMDHIEQYWKGGKTIPENARLTHRYCNWVRSKKE
jgi:hypothetical protein